MKAENIIEYELFEKVIEHIVLKGGLKEISISGGEPFLHKDLVNMVKLCKSHDIHTTIYTSGIVENQLKNIDLKDRNYTYIERKILEQLKTLDFSFIHKEILFELKKNGLDKIVFDFQAAECDGYNELMGTKNNMSNVLQSMINAKSAGLYTEIHFIPMKSNYKDIEDILELCDIGEIDRISILKFVPQGRGRINKENLTLSNDELREFCTNIEVLRKKYNVDIRLGIPMVNENRHLCTAGHDKLSIRYDGLVLPCVAFKEMDKLYLEAQFKKLGFSFELFSIRDNLDMLTSVVGSNKFPICKQIYKEN